MLLQEGMHIFDTVRAWSEIPPPPDNAAMAVAQMGKNNWNVLNDNKKILPIGAVQGGSEVTAPRPRVQ